MILFTNILKCKQTEISLFKEEVKLPSAIDIEATFLQHFPFISGLKSLTNLVLS